MEGSHNLVLSDAITELTSALGDSEEAKQIVETRAAFLEALRKPLTEQQVEAELIQGLISKAKSNSGKARVTDKRAPTASLSILYPVAKIREKLFNIHIIKKDGKPRGVPGLTIARDEEIISNFAAKARGLMNYYQPSHNIWDVKRVVNWTMRYSLLATLGQKHKKSVSWAIKTYGKEPVAYATLEDGSKIKLASFPTKKEINETTKGFPKVMDF